jgi:hypothetical protein
VTCRTVIGWLVAEGRESPAPISWQHDRAPPLPSAAGPSTRRPIFSGSQHKGAGRAARRGCLLSAKHNHQSDQRDDDQDNDSERSLPRPRRGGSQDLIGNGRIGDGAQAQVLPCRGPIDGGNGKLARASAPLALCSMTSQQAKSSRSTAAPAESSTVARKAKPRRQGEVDRSCLSRAVGLPVMPTLQPRTLPSERKT